MPPTCRIQLLGDFRIVCDDSKIIRLDSPRLQSLLAFLLLHREAPQSRHRLAFLLYPDSTEAQALANLRRLLHLLREALPGSEHLISADAQTVQWRPDAPFMLDVDEFQLAAAQAQTTAELRRAADSYRGDLLPSCYDDWIAPERERLRQMFIEVLSRLVGQLEAEQQYRAAIRYAEQLLRAEPLLEENYRRLMRLYALSGDRTGVVRVYNTCASVLQRELGIEPSAETRQAYEQWARFEAAQPVAPTPMPTARTNNLPSHLTSFIGRERAVSEVKQMLESSRLVTLTGAGGSGKTRLALAVAATLIDQFAHGVWWSDLAPLADASLIPQTIASALGAREQPGRPILDSLIGYLQEKELLLVLDNCEHLISACATLAEQLLQAAPRLRILATSREALNVAGERTWYVPTLSIPSVAESANSLPGLMEYESVRLYAERAAAALPTFTLDQASAPIVVQICQALDGIPLAIELAAARLKMLSVEQIAARLGDRFNLLTGGSRTALPRHQTLRASLDWSYDLLSEPEQALFRRLAVFVGGFTLDAAEAVCAGQEIAAKNILGLLSSLIDKSLVVAEEQGRAVRYRMLETVRQYALEKLLDSAETEPVRDHHLAFFLQLAEQAGPKLTSPQRGMWVARLDVEHDNFRAAWNWAMERQLFEVALRLVASLASFWYGRGYYNEGRRRLEESLARAGGFQNDSVRARALFGAGLIAWMQSDLRPAHTYLDESAALSRQLGPEGESTLALALAIHSFVASQRGDIAAARRFAEQSVVLFRQLDDKWGLSTALIALANSLEADAPQTARALAEESLGIQREFGDKFGMGNSLNFLGNLTRAEGDHECAASFYEQALVSYSDIGEKWGIAWALHNQGYAALHLGNHNMARQQFQASLAVWREMGSKLGIIQCLAGLAGWAAARAQPEHAARLFGATDALLRGVGGVMYRRADRIDYERNLTRARAELDEASFGAAWDAGRKLSLEQAIDYALNPQD